MTIDQPQTPEQIVEIATRDSIELMAKAEGFEISTADQYSASGELLKEIKRQQKQTTASRTEITRPMDEAKRRVMELFKPVSEQLGNAETTIKAAMTEFAQAEQRRQADEQARLDAIARKERERIERRAADARDKGQAEKADVLDQNAAATLPPKAEPVAKTDGVHTVTTWSAAVDDMATLIKAAAADPAIAAYLIPDMKALNAAAKAAKERLSIPGVRAVSSTTVAARA